MRLTHHDDETGAYWYAVTEDGGYDATGPDPLTAVARLCEVVETVLVELTQYGQPLPEHGGGSPDEMRSR